MSVAIYIPPSLQAIVDGADRFDVEGSTVGMCLRDLVHRYPRLKEKIFTPNDRLPAGMSIYINGKSASPRPLTRSVRDGDKIHIAYIVLGG